MRVDKFSPTAWREYSAQAHLIVFGKTLDPQTECVDLACVAREGDELMGYVTARKLDAETLYWKFGGAFPDAKGTGRSWRAYCALVACCLEDFPRITTLIENTNRVMLKMAAKVGFQIIGCRTVDGSVLLEHAINRTLFTGPKEGA